MLNTIQMSSSYQCTIRTKYVVRGNVYVYVRATNINVNSIYGNRPMNKQMVLNDSNGLF